jgi:hypothetical protein
MPADRPTATQHLTASDTMPRRNVPQGRRGQPGAQRDPHAAPTRRWPPQRNRPAASTIDLNPTRTNPAPKQGTAAAATQSDPPVTIAPCDTPNPRTPSLRSAAASMDDTGPAKRIFTPMRERWARAWPSLLAVVTLSAVGGPAAVASYRHARDVITQHGDPVMAPWTVPDLVDTRS